MFFNFAAQLGMAVAVTSSMLLHGEFLCVCEVLKHVLLSSFRLKEEQDLSVLAHQEERRA